MIKNFYDNRKMGRFKHRVVTNVPRVTSPGGEELRACFGVDHENGRIQFGFDFASLEAVMQGKYVIIQGVINAS